MESWALFLLLFVAIAVGWLLGRYGERALRRRSSIATRSAADLHGLDGGAGGERDQGLAGLMDGLDVNTDTLETHLAVGALLRRSGEVDGSVRVHEKLLTRRDLPRSDLQRARLELARDFISAGVLDRAERLLLDVQREAPTLREAAAQHLLDIYEQQRDWERAIDIAQGELSRQSGLAAPANRLLAVALSHYCCELAEQARRRSDDSAVHSWLRRALAYDARSVRASLLLADLARAGGQHDEALALLKRVREQDPGLLMEALPLLRDCYIALGRLPDWEQFLRDCLQETPSASLLSALTDCLCEQGRESEATAQIESFLRRAPSLRGIARLADVQCSLSAGAAREPLTLLRSLLDELLQKKPLYRCSHCGFAGRLMHWLCPGCRQWGQIRPIRGVEGEG